VTGVQTCALPISTDPKEHGLQVGHSMVIAQWHQKGGKLTKEVVWPLANKSANLVYPIK